MAISMHVQSHSNDVMFGCQDEVSKSLQVARKVYCDIGAPSMYTSVNLDIMQYICGFCGLETYHVFFEQALGRHLSFLLG